ncbi:hypothetical protein [Thalassobius sp. MITS945101]|uniref:hypothetical protein n=1 Tax=Thalassobius sp. MITS945101 TaxID=3096994 RepID=UPI00399A1D9A
MSTESPDIQEAIKIALASADTAGDAAVMAEKQANSMSNKAEWVDRKLVPFGIGGLVAVTLCAGLSGLVYFRTLSDLRTARDTHVEALHLFSQHVTTLQETVAKAEMMIESQAGEKVELAAALDGITKRIATMEGQIKESSDVTMAALGTGPDGFAARLAETMDPRVDAIRDEVMGGMSDLHLALSQKLSALANQLTAAAAKPKAQTFADAKEKTKPTPKPRTASKPKARPSTTKKTSSNASNPFSFP